MTLVYIQKIKYANGLPLIQGPISTIVEFILPRPIISNQRWLIAVHFTSISLLAITIKHF